MKNTFYAFYLALFFIISCQKKEVATNTIDFKKDKVASINLLTDHFIYTPYYYKDHVQSMCNIGENEFVYNIKNETNKTLMIFLNHVQFDVLHPTFLTDKNAIDSESDFLDKRYIQPRTCFSLKEMRSMLSKKNGNVPQLPINLSKFNTDKIGRKKKLELEPFEEIKIYVKTTLPKDPISISYSEILKSKNELLEFTTLSYFVVFDADEYFELKEKNQPLSNYQIYQLNKKLYFKFKN